MSAVSKAIADAFAKMPTLSLTDVTALREVEAQTDFAITRTVFSLDADVSDDVAALAELLLLDVAPKVAIEAAAAHDCVRLLLRFRPAAAMAINDLLQTSTSGTKLLRLVVDADAGKFAAFVAEHCDADRIAARVSQSLMLELLFLPRAGAPLVRKLPLKRLYAADRPHFNTAIHIAAGRGDLAAVQLCLDHGVSTSGTNLDGESPLFFAVRGLHTAVALLLLRTNGDGVLVRNIRGRTALDELDESQPGAKAFRDAFVAELRAWSVAAERPAVLAFFGVDVPAAKPPIEIMLCSDLHIEFSKGLAPTFASYLEAPPASCRYLALLGDIGLVVDPAYKQFVQSCLEGCFDRVFVVLGNHEFYKGEFTAVLKEAATLSALSPRISLLYRSATVISNGPRRVRVIGSTLWTHVVPYAALALGLGINDYRTIQNSAGLKAAQLTLENIHTVDVNALELDRAVADDFRQFAQACDEISVDQFRQNDGKRMRVCDTNALHKADLAFFNEQCALARDAGEECVIFCHHAPLMHTGVCAPSIWDSYQDFSEGTDLRASLIEQNPNLIAVCYGHTHWFQDVTIVSNGAHCRVVSNPKGYPTEPTRFVRSFVLRV
jgi:hypothetical protein